MDLVDGLTWACFIRDTGERVKVIYHKLKLGERKDIRDVVIIFKSFTFIYKYSYVNNKKFAFHRHNNV